MIPVHYNSIT